MFDLILTKNAGNSINSNGDVIVDQNELIEHFGELYALKPNDFRFQPGDRKFINLIQQTIMNTIEKKGRKRAMQHFGYKHELPEKKKKKDNTDTTDLTQSGKTKIKDNTDDTDLAQTMKTQLIKQIRNKLITCSIPNNLIEMFNESFVTVETQGNKIVKGGVVCVVCYAKSKQPKKIKPNNVHCRNKSGRLSWVISNFTKHFRRAHPSFENCNEKKVSESIDENSFENDEKKNINDDNASFDTMTREIMNMEMDFGPYIDEMDIIEIKRNEEISKQMIKMWNVTTMHGENLEYDVKCTDPSGLSISFDVVNIIGNGDCLLGSAAHQLFGKDINGDEHERFTKNLRRDIVKYIQEHYEHFLFEIRGHVYELREIAAKDPNRDTYGIGAIDDVDRACKYLVDDCLIRPGFWAGAETLKAIHCLYNVDIIILNENGPITYYNGNNQQVERAIVLAFRLSVDPEVRNHYDSVCNISPDDIYKIASLISTRQSQSNSSTVNLDASQK